MIDGEWLEISGEGLYHAYDPKKNKKVTDYHLDPREPIRLSWDFNIGEGKPLSVAVMQYLWHKDELHIFDEVVVHGIDTNDSLIELEEKGYFRGNFKLLIHGDATGRSRDTRSKKSDYAIIREYLKDHENKIDFEIRVPRSNPALRYRHNKVNGYCKNKKNKHRLFTYPKAKMADKGLRLTKLKPGGQYIEDDRPEYQHITTGIGYALCQILKDRKRAEQDDTGTRLL